MYGGCMLEHKRNTLSVAKGINCIQSAYLTIQRYLPPRYGGCSRNDSDVQEISINLLVTI